MLEPHDDLRHEDDEQHGAHGQCPPRGDEEERLVLLVRVGLGRQHKVHVRAARHGHCAVVAAGRQHGEHHLAVLRNGSKDADSVGAARKVIDKIWENLSVPTIGFQRLRWKLKMVKEAGSKTDEMAFKLKELEEESAAASSPLGSS